MVLKDRIALVTGASKGIGRATTVVLARCGAVTAIAGRAADGTARDVQAELAAFGRVSDIFPCDLSKAGAAEPLVTDVVERFGRLDILVNNAGLAIPEPLADISHESIAAQVSINLAAPIMLIQTAREHLARQQGHNRERLLDQRGWAGCQSERLFCYQSWARGSDTRSGT